MMDMALYPASDISLNTVRPHNFYLSRNLKVFCPSGKSITIIANRVKPQNKKYFAFPERQISGISLAIPSRSEGRVMIATNVGRGAVDAEVPKANGARRVRQRRVVLTPRCWRQVVR